MKTKCMSCGGSMKKMAVGGTTTKRIIKKSTGGMYGIPQENLGTSGQYGFAKKGGATGTHKMPNGKVMLNSKMQNGGSVDGPMEARRKIMGEKKPSLKRTLRYVKKNGSGLILKDKSKLQEGTYKPTMQKGGATKATKFAALAPPYNKATFADRIVGAKKKK
jgi:hypothetical protein